MNDNRRRERFYINGKRYEVKAKSGETDAQLIKRAALREKEILDGVINVNNTMSFEKWSAQWLEVYKSLTIEEPTLKDYENRINKKIKPILGKMKLSEIKPLH